MIQDEAGPGLPSDVPMTVHKTDAAAVIGRSMDTTTIGFSPNLDEAAVANEKSLQTLSNKQSSELVVPSPLVVLHSGYLFPAQAVMSNSGNSTSSLYPSTGKILNNQSNTHDTDVNEEYSTNLQFGQRKWFEICNDYHLYQYRSKSRSSSEANPYEFRTNLLQYHHILPLNYLSTSVKSCNENIAEIYAKQTPTYKSPLCEDEEEVAPPEEKLSVKTDTSGDIQTDSEPIINPEVVVANMNEEEDTTIMHSIQLSNANKKFMFCCKSDDQQEVLLMCTDSEQKRSEWICALKHLLHLGISDRNKFIQLGGNDMIIVEPAIPESISSSVIDIESLKKELTLFVTGLSRKIENNEMKRKEREERLFIQQQQSFLLKESIKGLSSFSTQSPPKLEPATSIIKNMNVDRLFHIEMLTDEIHRMRLDLFKDKLKLLSDLCLDMTNKCLFTLPYTNKQSSKPYLQSLLRLEEYLREISPSYFQKCIQLSKLLLAFEWRHVVLSLSEISKELSRWTTENLKKLDQLYTQSFELSTAKKSMGSTYQEILSRYTLYVQSYGLSNDITINSRLDSNVSVALNDLRQTKQEIFSKLSDTSIKLKQTNNQISLTVYQLGLIENLLIKVVNAQKTAISNLHHGSLVTNNVSQRLFILDEKFTVDREIKNLIELPSKSDSVDICFLKMTSRHLVEKFKSRIERGDSYLMQLKQVKEEILTEIKTQQLASSEERKRHASLMIKQIQQRLRNTLTTGSHSSYFCEQIHQYLQKFLNTPIDSASSLPKLTEFLKFLTEKVISIVKVGLSWYQIYEVLESIIFEYITETRGMIMYDSCLYQVRNEMRMVDENFNTKCAEISQQLVGQLLLDSKKIDEKDLSDPEFRQFVIEEEISKFKEEYKVPIELIRTLSEDAHERISSSKPYSPSAKLNIITTAAKDVMSRIYSSKTKLPHTNKAESDQYVSTDDFLPIFICVICTAAIRDMFTQINFIKEFAFPDYLVGEHGFFLSSFESGAFFILNFGSEDENNIM